MTNNPPPEWRNWGDHPVIVGIGLISALVGIIIFLTGKENLGAFMSSESPFLVSTSVIPNTESNEIRSTPLPAHYSAEPEIGDFSKYSKIITADEGDTVHLYNNSVFVTVNSINPTDYTANITIGSPGYPNQSANLEKLGSTVLYQGKSEYEVRLIKIRRGFNIFITDLLISDVSTIKSEAVPPIAGYSEEISIESGSTGAAFDGIIIINIASIDPKTGRVVAVIGSPGYARQTVDFNSGGAFSHYEAGSKYEIRLIEGRSSFPAPVAKFVVTKIN